jgi:4-hydroxy-3-methylbut-2-enyl diphosphate reductase IspH
VERLNILPVIVEEPEIKESGPGSGTGHWVVTVYDNDFNTVDEVVLILIKATCCSLDEAQMETWEIHTLGKSVVHHGDESECHEVAGVIGQIGIRVEVSSE